MARSFHRFLVALSLFLSLPLGAAELQLTGLPFDKRKKLVAQLSPRLDFIKTREPSPWRADDAAFFFKRLLIRTGHADAEVDWELPGGNVILLKATPGPHYRYGEISATRLGLLQQDELKNYFLEPLVETEVVDAKDAPYIADYDEPGVTNVTNLLKSRGYWNASVRIARKTTDQLNQRINITLDLNPGRQHTLAQPTFSGASAKELSFFKSKMTAYSGRVANTETLSSVRSLVEGYYREHGYEFANIMVIPRHHNGQTHLAFNIDRGERYRVDKVTITGNNSTKKKRIHRHFNVLIGKPFNKKNTNAALSKLLSTGAFSHATVTPLPDASGNLDIHVEVAEGKARTLRSYAGIGSYEGTIIGTSYTDLNFTGRLLTFNAIGEYSNQGLLGETSITEPFLGGEAIQLHTRAFLLQRDYDGYDKKEAGGELSLLWTPSNIHSTRLHVGSSYVSTNSAVIGPVELGPEDYLHTRTGIQQTIDLRNSRTHPSKGFYIRALLELGNIAGDASAGYFLGQLDSSYRHPISENQILMARFSSGSIHPNETVDLPIDLRMFNGGPDSVRSFNTRELSPRSLEDTPLGGLSYWNASLEYTLDISEPTSAVFFLDAGQTYEDYSIVDFSNPSYAAGAGLRIAFPIGSVRFEYGHNLNKRKGEPDGTLHFVIGTTF